MKHVTKVKINLMLTVTFVLVFVTGILLHLIKKHGLVFEPGEVLKVVHYVAGFLMVACALCHVWFTFKVFRIVGASRRIFFFFTCLLELVLFLVFVTGALKLFSPVRIPHLGLVHYWFGIIMSVSAAVHLFTVLPWLVRNLKHLRRK